MTWPLRHDFYAPELLRRYRELLPDLPDRDVGGRGSLPSSSCPCRPTPDSRQSHDFTQLT